jgi:phosphoribosylformylglycinamidine synthase
MQKKACVIQFLGSNCDDEVITALHRVGFDVKKVFYRDCIEGSYDLVVLPGGFSYGDYLRSGAMAAKMPIMSDVASHAKKGGFVVGICNGFQILTESGMLPGALMRSTKGHFVCKDVYLKTNTTTQWALNNVDDVFKVQIAHADGRYFDNQDAIKQLEDSDCIAFRYCSVDGVVNDDSNPNGSINNIAGIFGGVNRNIIGLMPHPERMIESGLSDRFFKCFA